VSNLPTIFFWFFVGFAELGLGVLGFFFFWESAKILGLWAGLEVEDGLGLGPGGWGWGLGVGVENRDSLGGLGGVGGVKSGFSVGGSGGEEFGV
jgi:hypothetical protein